MDRLTKKSGLTLLELIVAVTLLTTVVLTASALLISFKKYYYDFTQKEYKVGEITLAVLEEIVNKIVAANQVTITGASRIDIKIDEANTPTAPADDTTYTYKKDLDKIKYAKNGGTDKIIAEYIALLKFELHPTADPALNRVKITIGITAPGSQQQDFETTVITRGKCAQA